MSDAEFVRVCNETGAAVLISTAIGMVAMVAMVVVETVRVRRATRRRVDGGK